MHFLGIKELPGKRIVYLPDEFKVADCIPTQGRREGHREVPKLAKLFSQVDSRDIVDNIEQGHTRTGRVYGLTGEKVSNNLAKGYMDIAKPDSQTKGLLGSFVLVCLGRPLSI